VRHHNRKPKPGVEKALQGYAAECRRAAQNKEAKPSLEAFLAEEGLRWMADSPLSFSFQNFSAGLDLSGADFSGMKFHGSVFLSANFSHAILHNTDMEFTDLEGCDFTGAEMATTELRGAYLNFTKGIIELQKRPWNKTSIIMVPDGKDKRALKLLRLSTTKPS